MGFRPIFDTLKVRQAAERTVLGCRFFFKYMPGNASGVSCVGMVFIFRHILENGANLE